MIPIWISDSERNPISYNGLTLNQLIGGDERDIIEISRIVPQTPMQHAIEAREFSDGVEAYGAFSRGKRLVMYGIVRASSRGVLYDRMEEISAATHPAVLSRSDPEEFGVQALDFSVPTDDTVNFPSGLMPCRYYVRAEQAFEPPMSSVQGLSVPFILPFFAPDARRYLQAESSKAGDGTANNSIATTWSWPTLTIDMLGAGATNFTIANESTDKALTLNLAGRSDGEQVVVSMESRAIVVDGVEMAGLYQSGSWFTIEAGGNIIDVSNNTNANATLTWRPAFTF